MTPTEFFQLLRYLRFREETWKRFNYWLRQRHPEWGRPNWFVLWAGTLSVGTVMVFSISLSLEEWWPLAVPVAALVVSGYVWLVHRAYRSDCSPAKKFQKYGRRRH